MKAKEIAGIIDRINTKTNRYYIDGEGRFSPEDIEMIALHRQLAIFEAGRIEGIKEVVDFVEEHMSNLEEWTGWQEMKEEWGIEEIKEQVK